MIDLNRILLPTDFSNYSHVAVGYACALAEKFGAELHLLHVVQDVIALVPEPGLAFPVTGIDPLEMQAAAEEGLTRVIEPENTAGLNVVRAVRQGPPFLEIIRYARENDIGLIVMGTHGRSGLAHALMGSVAEKVVRKSPCPVLTVHPADHQFVMP